MSDNTEQTDYAIKVRSSADGDYEYRLPDDDEWHTAENAVEAGLCDAHLSLMAELAEARAEMAEMVTVEDVEPYVQSRPWENTRWIEYAKNSLRYELTDFLAWKRNQQGGKQGNGDGDGKGVVG